MKSSHITILAIAAGVAVVAAAGVSMMGPGPGQNVMATGKIFPALAGQINDVGTIVLARKAESITLKRTGETWGVAERAGYPADFKKVRAMLVELSQMRPLEQKTASPALFGTLDVEDLSTPDAKSALVTLKDASDKEMLALYIGKQRFGRGPAAGGANAGDGTYVRKSGDNQSWLAQAKLNPDRTAVQWLDRPLINVARERVAAAAVVQPDGATLKTIKAKATDADFKLDGTPIPAGQKIKSDWDLNQVGSTLDLLDLDDVRPASEVPVPDKAGYAEYRTFDGLISRATVVTKDDQSWVVFSARYVAPAVAPTDDEKAKGKLKSAEEVTKEVDAFNAKTSGWAYKIPDWKMEYVKRKLPELLIEDDKKS